MRKAPTVAVVLGILFALASAQEWTPGTFPNPSQQSGSQACGRKGVQSSVCDPDHLISYASANVVEGIVKDIERATPPYARDGCTAHSTDLPGFQVAVALMNKMQLLPGGARPGRAAADFAAELFNAWGVGDAACGNGVLLLLSKQDRQVHILAGRQALEVAGTDKLNAVIADMRPQLRAGDVEAAVEQAVVDIGLVLAGAEVKPGHESGSWLPLGIVVAVIGSFLGFHIWQSRKPNRCQKLLDKLKTEQATAMATGRYPAASCPICFEDFDSAEDTAPSAPPFEPPAAPKKEEVGKGGLEVAAEEVGPSAPLLTRRRSSREKLAGMASGTGTTPERVAPGADGKKKPLALPCGHTFCEPCIASWLESHSSCPVCRRTVGDVEQSSSGALTSQQQYRGPELYTDEIMFRMGRLQLLYPDVISAGHISHAAEAARRGQCVNWESVRHQQLQADVRQQHMDSGVVGSSHSFGGGSSFGGGGVGGSW